MSEYFEVPGTNMRAEYIEHQSLPSLLMENGALKLYAATYYDSVPPHLLRLWCHVYARYGLPTIGLVTWLREFIGTRRAIEIGSGSGDLAYHLQIPATDNRMQEWPEIAKIYAAMGQPLICYPNFVERLDAMEALEKYRPEIVIASWVTEWVDPNLPAPPGGGNIYGVHEDKIIDSGVTYVLVGNEDIHGKKSIMSRPHEEYRLPFLRSRAKRGALNRVWVWS